MGRMSLLNVTEGESDPASVPAQTIAMRSAFLDMSSPGLSSSQQPVSVQPADPSNRLFLSPIGWAYRAIDNIDKSYSANRFQARQQGAYSSRGRRKKPCSAGK